MPAPSPSAPPAAPPDAEGGADADAAPAARTRVNDIALARFERWALPAMARRLPPWVGPDTLTATALVGAVLAFAGYALAGRSLAFVHLASFGLVLNWWGDSLDGTVARVRQIRRERYGFYVDHVCDVATVALLFGGLGAGPLLRLDLALGLGAVVLMLFNLVNLVTIARGVFKISFAGVGPTEGRLVLIAANTGLWLAGNPTVSVAGWSGTVFDALAAVAVVVLLAAWLVAAVREGLLMARLDPRPAPGQDGYADDPTGQGLGPASGGRGGLSSDDGA
ncbi:CDP-alcohol phosphatidyltransferase family protein [Rubrivirga sp. S365]|uniref:CDP-alcohol phosphatidyltransferase family protein n=1 Tax=Rubrivirga litoralis TaxID=3075598 RepID=A0ABU3BUZ4_9BACT|nr:MULTISPECIES: CDP-alcohol phosphatidyltransferase family protein [unclassified Rubrivirga]MDT0633097.1 CDP-alcohol phosphatidyltransferase family protein [Rubrivirga sp. F394]MDT7857861.1 CDP-alcohol phosphatidyltransferase family protein [Rubrivirga sp. S365]